MTSLVRDRALLLSIFATLGSGPACTTVGAADRESRALDAPRPLTLPEEHKELTPVPIAVEVQDPVVRGELPWWHTLKDGLYRYRGEVVVLAIGRSDHHHHVAEGFLASKVGARLAVRKASERVRFTGAVPEPELEDLFITREHAFLALYLARVPKDAGLPTTIPTLSSPEVLMMKGRRRVGRHVYEEDRHLFLECDVEGPIANPDWGRTRASARG